MKNAILPFLSACLYLKKKILGVKKACIKIVFHTPNVCFLLNTKPNPIAVLQREELKSRQFAFN